MFTPRLHISFFGKRIHSFHFFGIVGFIVGLVLGVTIAAVLNLNPWVVLLMAAVGAFVFFLLVYVSKAVTGREIIVYYHHEIGILLFCTLVLYVLGLPVLSYLDITLLGIGVFLAFGRLGCYSVGCCHGRPSGMGVRYGDQHVAAGFTWYYRDTPLFPIQLIESAAVGMAVITGIFLLLNGVAPGTIFIFYTISYGMLRYLLEFYRGDPERPVYKGLSEAQWTSWLLASFTFGLSLAGWLPYYTWHFYLLVVMTLTSLAIIFFIGDSERALFFPGHIQQIADGLQKLNEKAPGISMNHHESINVYITVAGLCISCSKPHSNELATLHYSISSKGAIRLSRKSADKIARHIAILKRQISRFEIVENGNGVYHILFATASDSPSFVMKYDTSLESNI